MNIIMASPEIEKYNPMEILILSQQAIKFTYENNINVNMN